MKNRVKAIILVLLLIPLLVMGGQSIRENIEAKRTTWILSAPDITSTLAFSPDSEMLAGGEGSHPPTLKIWKWKSGTLLHDIKTEHNAAITEIMFSANGRNITTGGADDGWLRTWDTFTGKKVRALASGKIISTAPVGATSRDGLLVAFPRGSNIIVQNAKSHKIFRIFKTSETGFHALAFSPDRKWLAGSSVRKIYVWKVTH